MCCGGDIKSRCSSKADWGEIVLSIWLFKRFCCRDWRLRWRVVCLASASNQFSTFWKGLVAPQPFVENAETEAWFEVEKKIYWWWWTAYFMMWTDLNVIFAAGLFRNGRMRLSRFFPQPNCSRAPECNSPSLSRSFLKCDPSRAAQTKRCAPQHSIWMQNLSSLSLSITNGGYLSHSMEHYFIFIYLFIYSPLFLSSSARFHA